MSKFLHLACFTALLYLAASCIPLTDKPLSPTDNPDDYPWKKFEEISANLPIRGIHVTPFEVFFISNNSFFRLNNKLILQEKRLLPVDRSFFGAPILSDNVFVRVTQNASNDAVFEFNSTRNAQNMRKITASELVDTARREIFVPEAVYDQTLQPGVFSADGSKLLLVGSINSNKIFAIVIDVQLDFTSTNFSKISVVNRVELPGLLSKKLESIRFINGNFYVATQNGGYRVTPTGEVKKVFSHWTLDFFAMNNILYASPYSAYDFHTSSDNGLTWRRSAPSDLKYVDVVNKRAFTKISRGVSYVNIGDSSLTKQLKVKYNPDLFTNTREAVDYHIRYFKDKYFMNDGAEVYAVDSIRTIKQ
ncbi:MAG: hypothetical protein U5L45_23125 [Saprospiraceae bacterium]|nr:hypothetical protein [Saprospiraceae bacterium]